MNLNMIAIKFTRLVVRVRFGPVLLILLVVGMAAIPTGPDSNPIEAEGYELK